MESNRFCGKSCIGLAVTLQTSEATSSSDWLVLLFVALQWKSALLFNNHGNFFPLSLYIHYPLVFLCQHKWIIEHLPLQETQTKYMVEERIKTKFQGGDLCCKKYFWEGETPWCRQVFFFFFFLNLSMILLIAGCGVLFPCDLCLSYFSIILKYLFEVLW